ncbi:MAG: DsbA family protein [Nitrospira sp.]|nr:MAG: DsbA family protein [Nitrospira sp.]
MVSDYLLYSDFNCPFCYALHERLHELQLIDRCEWRGVQHAPHLPRPMKVWAGSLEAELRQEVAVVQRLAPGLPIALPSGKPNTGPAISLAASLFQRDRAAGMQTVRALYHAFWVKGQDISNPLVLDEFGITDGSDLDQVREEWDAAWHETGQAGVPLVVSPGGVLLVGCVSTEQIQAFFRLHD